MSLPYSPYSIFTNERLLCFIGLKIQTATFRKVFGVKLAGNSLRKICFGVAWEDSQSFRGGLLSW